MFDIGFWELALLALIALIVLGPERLPIAARTVGRWVGTAKRLANQLTSELEHEVHVENFRKEMGEFRSQVNRSFEQGEHSEQEREQAQDPKQEADSDDTPPNQ